MKGARRPIIIPSYMHTYMSIPSFQVRSRDVRGVFSVFSPPDSTLPILSVRYTRTSGDNKKLEVEVHE